MLFSCIFHWSPCPPNAMRIPVFRRVFQPLLPLSLSAATMGTFLYCPKLRSLSPFIPSAQFYMFFLYSNCATASYILYPNWPDLRLAYLGSLGLISAHSARRDLLILVQCTLPRVPKRLAYYLSRARPTSPDRLWQRFCH